MKNTDKSMATIVSLCQQRGFIFQGSEIYGGLANSWDYGALGSALKDNIKAEWKKAFIQRCPYNVGLDSAILMNPTVWKASADFFRFKKCPFVITAITMFLSITLAE
jgi:glycyl-tRNA synthetase